MPNQRDDQGSADHIRGLERQRLRALVQNETAVADALHSENYQLITPGGAAMSKADYLGGVASGELRTAMSEAASKRVYR